VWILGAFIAAAKILVTDTITRIIAITLLVVLLLVNAYFIFKISQIIHRHSAQIQAQQQSVQQSINMPRYKKSVNTMYYVIGAFAVCYVPLVGSLVAQTASNFSLATQILFYLFACTSAMFNGVLNPFIYCWRSVEIRTAARRLLPGTCGQNNIQGQ
jgi:hypothetical protein